LYHANTTSDHTCVECTSGTYNNISRHLDSECQPCSRQTCTIGTYLALQCFAKRDILCADCAGARGYSTLVNHTSTGCTSWTDCFVSNKVQDQPGTSVMDRTCKCDLGNYLSFDGKSHLQ
jgi:hypothetical protein